MKKIKIIIEEDPKVGFYIFGFDNTNNELLYDYLQDDIKMAKLCAKEEFLLTDNWKEIIDFSCIATENKKIKLFVTFGFKKTNE